MNGEAERRHVGAQGLHGRFRVGAFPVTPQIGIAERARVTERKPVVAARPVGQVQFAGRKVVAQMVAAVVGEPELAGDRMPREPDRVADPPRVDLDLGAVGAHPEHAAVVAVDPADVAGGADRGVETAVRPEPQHLPPVVLIGGQLVRDGDGGRRVVQPGLDVVKTQDRADDAHEEGPVAERDSARHQEPGGDHAHAFPPPVAVVVGYREHPSIPAGADEERALLAPGHLPRVGNLGKRLDDETLGQADGGKTFVRDRFGTTEQRDPGHQEEHSKGAHKQVHMFG